MGLLTDDPDYTPTQGAGQKLIDLYAELDGDDQAKIRAWVEDGRPGTYVQQRLAAAGFHMDPETVRRGIARLKATSWAS